LKPFILDLMAALRVVPFWKTSSPQDEDRQADNRRTDSGTVSITNRYEWPKPRVKLKIPETKIWNQETEAGSNIQ